MHKSSVAIPVMPGISENKKETIMSEFNKVSNWVQFVLFSKKCRFVLSIVFEQIFSQFEQRVSFCHFSGLIDMVKLSEAQFLFTKKRGSKNLFLPNLLEEINKKSTEISG